ncbi:MAG: pilus assembly protein [Anderseniella sp.]|jgi:Flp pilus assembly protein TadG|nr:pilus assembly protein [Anderseniella sp.]
MQRFANRLAASFRRLRKDQSGATALVIGLAAIPLVMAAGAGVDYGNWVAVNSRLQAATDAAALAAGRAMNKTEEERRQIANDYFHANFGQPKNSGVPSMTMALDELGNINVTGQVTVKNYLASVAGFAETKIAAAAQVKKASEGLEVVLVFDNTGSMGQLNRLNTLKKAANDFVEILFNGKSQHPGLKIGVVPFSQFVNVGPDKATALWVDTGGLNPQSSVNFLDPAWHNWTAWQAVNDRQKSLTWPGCVESRAGAMSIDDTTPDVNNGATLFPPAFAPDEPGKVSDGQACHLWDGTRSDCGDKSGKAVYNNNYMTDSKEDGFSLDVRQRDVGKYGKNRANTNARGPDKGCNIQPILALTSTKAPVLDTIKNMKADGYTHVAEGVGWGLRVLSPTEPYTEGASWDDDTVKKVMVLLTDGENTFNVDDGANHNGSSYTAYGFLNQNRLGTTDYWTGVAAQNTMLGQACDLVKSKKVTIYTFSYNVPSATQRDLIKACATDAEKFYDPKSDEALVTNFNEIADEIRRLHLSK